MTTIVSYRKTRDAYTTYELRTPDANGDVYCAELCTLDGITYVSVPAGITLPEQLPQVAATLQTVTLTPELREQLKAMSPHCALIAERMVQRIREKYSVEDEQYFSRIGVGVALGAYAFEPGEQDALLAFGAHVEAVRQWGRAERAKLGL